LCICKPSPVGSTSSPGLFRRHFVHRGNLLSWSMAVEHSLQRDGRPISLEEDGIIHRKGKQWRERERENWAVSRTPIESLSTSDLWLVTRIIHPVIVSTALPAAFPSQKLVKNTSTAIGHPPSSLRKYFGCESCYFPWKQRESERGSLVGVNAIKISSITIGDREKKNARSAANGSNSDGSYWDLRIESCGPEPHAEKSFNSITDFNWLGTIFILVLLLKIVYSNQTVGDRKKKFQKVDWHFKSMV
jgi:hypothetical protein